MKQISILTILCLLCSGPLTAAEVAHKPTVVLVHGAFETADVWGQVAAGMRQDGFKVIVVDLPGRPGNELPADQVSLAGYQRAVAAAIADERQPVVLVGHSFGGIVVSQEAEAEPRKIKTLVYVAAYLPQNGQSLLTLATADTASKLGPILMIDKDHGLASVPEAAAGAVFANDLPARKQAQVAAAIVDEPLAPLAAPVALTAAKFGAVDKVSIRTLRDVVISPAFQAQMDAATPVRLQLTIDTGHTPFIGQPRQLAMLIERAAR